MTDATLLGRRTGEAGFGDYFALLKPRVMSLVVFTAFVGLIVAPVPVHPMVGFAAILCIAVGAGASGALNMWWDADIDAMMRRTANRPVPAGRVTGGRGTGDRPGALGPFGLMLWLSTNLRGGRCFLPSPSSSTPSSTRCGSSAGRRRTS